MCARVQLLLTQSCQRGPPRLFECVDQFNARHGLSHAIAPERGGRRPRAYAVYPNAQFGVSRDRIRGEARSPIAPPIGPLPVHVRPQQKPKLTRVRVCGRVRVRLWVGAARPLALYEALLAEFDALPDEQCFVLGGPHARPHRGTCAIMEWLWHTMMGEPPILDSRLALSGDIRDD
jgi:hypothetical protein